MQLVFKERREAGGGAVSFTFTPAEPLTWQAGQSIKIEVPGPYGPLEHRFTIAAAPYEQLVTITTRLGGSPYKNSLAALQPGDKVNSYAIEGTFTWLPADTPHIFVAAGVGITPYYAMLKQRVHDQQPIAATLIYNDVVYKDQLDDWAKNHPEFTVHYITGRRLTVDDIPKTKGLIYLSGPSLMVDEFSAALIARGTAEAQLVRDWFTGRLPV